MITTDANYCCVIQDNKVESFLVELYLLIKLGFLHLFRWK